MASASAPCAPRPPPAPPAARTLTPRSLRRWRRRGSVERDARPLANRCASAVEGPLSGIEDRGSVLRVYFLDQGYKAFHVRRADTVRHVCLLLREKIGLVNDACFSLYEHRPGGFSRVLDDDDTVMGVMDAWQGLQPAVDPAQCQLVYRRRIYLPQSPEEDEMRSATSPESAAHHLAYADAKFHVTQGLYPTSPEQATVLAALAVHAAFGNHDPAVHKAGFLLPRIREYVQPAVLDAAGASEAQVEAAVLGAHGRLQGRSRLEAETLYLQNVQRFPFYGATFFRVRYAMEEAGSKRGRDLQTEAVRVLCAVGHSGVHFLSGPANSMIETHLYEAITKWTLSPDGSVFAFSVHDTTVVYVVSEQAAEIEKVVRTYVGELVSLINGRTRTAAREEEEEEQEGGVEGEGEPEPEPEATAARPRMDARRASALRSVVRRRSSGGGTSAALAAAAAAAAAAPPPAPEPSPSRRHSANRRRASALKGMIARAAAEAEAAGQQEAPPPPAARGPPPAGFEELLDEATGRVVLRNTETGEVIDG